MAKELPYYKFNVAEHLLGRISTEKDNIKGMFISTCAYYWHKECDITKQEIEKKIGKKRIETLITKQFLLLKDDKIVIPFLNEQRLELLQTSSTASKNGKKGAEKKWGGYSQDIASSHSETIALREDKIIKDNIKIDNEKELLNSFSIIEQVGKHFKSEEVAKEKLKIFIAEQKAIGKFDGRTIEDLRGHYLFWAKKQPIEITTTHKPYKNIAR